MVKAKNYGSLMKKIITDKNGVRRTVYVAPKGNIGTTREDMPQVVGEHHEEFIKWLNEQGVKTKEKSMDVHDLKATQKEINNKKVDEMIAHAEKTGETKWLRRTIIVSKDNHVLDGHHRWAALHKMEGKQHINALKVNLPIKELLKVTAKFPKVQKRNINSK